MASNVASEGTAAAENAIGELRRDPFAMLPFCGYNMGDYFAHWLKMGKSTDESLLPRIFYVNWFRRSADGHFLWPGFGDNSRVLAWIVGRLDGTATGADTPIGVVPRPDSLDLSGLDISDDDLRELLSVNDAEWRREASLIPQHFDRFGRHLPTQLWQEYDALVRRLEA
jgi:phosphoenolpyruvate carboxykinase (GTP)